MPTAREDHRRRLPSVDEVLREPRVHALEQDHGREAVVREVRAALAEARSEGSEADGDQRLRALPDELARRLAAAARPSLVRVINATGVVLHTNLGRAPLAARGGRGAWRSRRRLLEPRVRPRRPAAAATARSHA